MNNNNNNGNQNNNRSNGRRRERRSRSRGRGRNANNGRRNRSGANNNRSPCRSFVDYPTPIAIESNFNLPLSKAFMNVPTDHAPRTEEIIPVGPAVAAAPRTPILTSPAKDHPTPSATKGSCESTA
jgi:hypothetical protein